MKKRGLKYRGLTRYLLENYLGIERDLDTLINQSDMDPALKESLLVTRRGVAWKISALIRSNGRKSTR